MTVWNSYFLRKKIDDALVPGGPGNRNEIRALDS